MSNSCTSYPAWRQSWAIPAPIVPAPTMPIVSVGAASVIDWFRLRRATERLEQLIALVVVKDLFKKRRRDRVEDRRHGVAAQIALIGTRWHDDRSFVCAVPGNAKV